jgi:phospholipase C
MSSYTPRRLRPALSSPRIGALAALGALAACSTEETTGAAGTGDPGVPPGPAHWNRTVTPPTDAEAADKRAACAYSAGYLAAETQGASHPNGSEIPIDHIVVVMMENRSFDHYFQKLPEAGVTDVAVAEADFSNPDPDGKPVGIFHQTDYCFVDTNHEWTGTHEQVAGGKMSGFVKTNEGHHEVPAHGTPEMLSGTRAMGYYDETDLPFYYWLAKQFAIADRYFCSVQGPTWPNRMYLYAATSYGHTSNLLPPPGCQPTPTDTSAKPECSTTLLDFLSLREVDWKIYADNGAAGMTIFPDKVADADAAGRYKSFEDFQADAAAGTLPGFAYVDPTFRTDASWDGNDEHPPANAQIGQRYVAEIVKAVTESPAWPRTALFITYDEHGGLYDHVPPPSACAPDEIEPDLEPGEAMAKFDALGVRVPLIVVSPYARKKFVSHQTYDHTSITRFVEARFVLPALSRRDANALAPWDMFDFSKPPNLTPPKVTLPEIDQAKLDACKAVFEP